MLDFYRDKRVFVTGHTGFKGSWLCAILEMAGAKVTGYALAPASPSLCEFIGAGERTNPIYGDIRDLDSLWAAFERAQPEIVFHLAAQPIVRESYRDPVGTYSTNVMGTVHILECVRRSGSVRSFLAGQGVAVSTARAGNVIGGGDFAADRIIPDCVRAVQKGEPIQLRNPDSIRPYQHVLDPLAAYLLIVQRQYEDAHLASNYNVGPDSCDCLSSGQLAELFCAAWGKPARWECIGHNGPHEDAVLKLDCSKIRSVLGWKPKWNAERAVAETVAWTKAWIQGQDTRRSIEEQIDSFFGR